MKLKHNSLVVWGLKKREKSETNVGTHLYTHTHTHTHAMLYTHTKWNALSSLLLQAKKTSVSNSNSPHLAHPEKVTMCVVKMEEQGHQKSGFPAPHLSEPRGPGTGPQNLYYGCCRKFKTTDRVSKQKPRWPLAANPTQTVWVLEPQSHPECHLVLQPGWFRQTQENHTCTEEGKALQVAMMREQKEGEERELEFRCENGK